MNNEKFEFKVGDRVCIEGVLDETLISDYPLGLKINGHIFMIFTENGKCYKHINDEPILKLIERPKPKLTFEFIRNNLVPMKHLLVDMFGHKRLYIGFNRVDELVTDNFTGAGVNNLIESNIENWTYEEYNG